MRRVALRCGAILLAAFLWLGSESQSQAQYHSVPLNRHYYYPYYYFPHNYWPNQSPQWPEPIGAKYRRPPAYMAYPPFLEPHWRYNLFSPTPYYRGNHFWLDAF